MEKPVRTSLPDMPRRLPPSPWGGIHDLMEAVDDALVAVIGGGLDQRQDRSARTARGHIHRALGEVVRLRQELGEVRYEKVDDPGGRDAVE
jgi:hypothetical protein